MAAGLPPDSFNPESGETLAPEQPPPPTADATGFFPPSADGSQEPAESGSADVHAQGTIDSVAPAEAAPDVHVQGTVDSVVPDAGFSFEVSEEAAAVASASPPAAGRPTRAAPAGAMTRQVRRPPPRLPQVHGYEILGELGRGAMGVVYKAKQIGLNRPCALKMILAGGKASDLEIRRFRTEAESVAQLQHPNIVQIYEIGEHDGLPFFSLEFVDGGCLADRIAEEPIPIRQSVSLVKCLAEAMSVAHRAGIIHRDLKPANVLLTASGIPRITDFGLARKLEEDSSSTRTGAIMGTPSYMAPEQAAGLTKEIGPLADVYALGAILYDLLTGRPPFRGTTLLDTLDQVRKCEPVPPVHLLPHLSPDVETICLKCLRKEPAKRYASAAALAEDLGRYLAGEPIFARPTPIYERAWKWCRRRPAVASLLAVCSLFVMSLVLGGIAYARSESARAVEAERLFSQSEAHRRQAEEHFLQAREAVNQMLTRVGEERLAHEPRMEQVRRDLLVKAAQFYERFLASDDVTPVVRHEAALTWRKVGDIRRMLDEDAPAERAYRQALARLEQLVKDNPDESAYRVDLAATLTNLGALLRHLRRFNDSAAVQQRAVALQTTLLQEQPSDPGRQRELGAGQYNLGRLYAALGQADQAERSCRAALAIQQGLVEKQPDSLDDRRALARSHQVLGQLLASRPGEAEKSLRKALTLLEGLVKAIPAVPGYREELLLASNQLGLLLRDVRPDKAEPLYRRAIELGENLVADFPTIPAYRQELAESLNNLGVLWRSAGQRAEADRLQQRGLALKEQLAGDFPRRPEFRRDLAASLDNHAIALLLQGQPADARKSAARAVELLRGLLEKESVPADQRALALALANLGAAEQVGEAAEKALREALALQTTLRGRLPGDIGLRGDLARTRWILATLLQARGINGEAAHLHDLAITEFRALAKEFPAEPTHRQSLAGCLNNLADLLRVLRKPKEAEKTWREAESLLVALAARYPLQPIIRREQAKVLHNLGFLYNSLERLTESETTHNKALDLRAALVKAFPGESAYRQELASSYAELAITQARRNRIELALANFQRAIALLEKLSKASPASLALSNDLIIAHGNLAGLLQALTRDEEALQHWRRQIEVKRKRLELDLANAAARSELGRSLHELGVRLQAMNRPAEAVQALQEAITVQKVAVLLSAGAQADLYRLTLCAHHLGLADVLLAQKDHAGAAKAIADVLPSVPPRWPSYPVAAALLARCVPLAAKDEKLAREKREELARVYGDRAMECLHKAREAGFKDSKALRQAEEFAPLRERADFRKLLEEMEPKK